MEPYIPIIVTAAIGLIVGFVVAKIIEKSSASQALNRAKVAYQSGQLRFVELRSAQTNKLQAETGLLNAQMNLIRIRYSIKRLMGELI